MARKFLPTWKPGSQPPNGYIAWHSWAEAQHKAGLRQSWCVHCELWKYPQEKCCGAVRIDAKTFDRTAKKHIGAEAFREEIKKRFK